MIHISVVSFFLPFSGQFTDGQNERMIAQFETFRTLAPLTPISLGQQTTLSLNVGEEAYFTVNVAANQRVHCFVEGNNGDVDLYVKFGSRPSRTDYEYHSAQASSREKIGPTDTADIQRTLFALVYGYTGSKNSSFRCKPVPTCGGLGSGCGRGKKCCGGFFCNRRTKKCQKKCRKRNQRCGVQNKCCGSLRCSGRGMQRRCR